MTTTISTTVTAPHGASLTLAPAAPDLPAPSRRQAVRRRSVTPPASGALAKAQDLIFAGELLEQLWLRVFRPVGVRGPLPVVLYIHGGDAPLRDPRTQRQAFELAAEVQAAVVLVDYSLSPAAHIAVPLEENYAALAWLARHGAKHGLDATRIAVGADWSGADQVDELMVIADKRGGPVPCARVVCTPQTTAVLRAALAS